MALNYSTTLYKRYAFSSHNFTHYLHSTGTATVVQADQTLLQGCEGLARETRPYSRGARVWHARPDPTPGVRGSGTRDQTLLQGCEGLARETRPYSRGARVWHARPDRVPGSGTRDQTLLQGCQGPARETRPYSRGVRVRHARPDPTPGVPD